MVFHPLLAAIAGTSINPDAAQFRRLLADGTTRGKNDCRAGDDSRFALFAYVPRVEESVIAKFS
jgi:hypothetical protein